MKEAWKCATVGAMALPSRTLVGRDVHLRILLDAFADSRSGAPRSLLLLAQDGAGSHALAPALRHELGNRGLAHRWVATRGRRSDSAYGSLAALLAAHEAPDAAEGGHHPAGLEVVLADLMAVPVEARPTVVGERLAQSLSRAGAHALVLVIERVDALDPVAASALATAARALAGTRSLVLATSADDTDWPADRILRVGPLDEREASTLAAQLAPDDPQRAAALAALSRGLPGQMVSLSRWADPRVPAAEQLAALHPQTAGLVLVAGLAEGYLDDGALAAAAGCEMALIPQLHEHGILRRQPTSPNRGWEVPTAWWEAAGTALPPGAAVALSARAGEALRRAGAPARLVARAWELAGDPRAVGAWVSAAEHATPDADARAAHLARAWRIAAGDLAAPAPHGAADPDAPALPDLARTCADGLLAVGAFGQALEVLADALRALPRRDRAARARLLACRHRALLQAGQHEAARTALDEALGLIPESPGHDLAVALAMAEVTTLSSMADVLVDPGRAGATAELAHRMAELTSDTAAQAAALGALALATGLRGDLAGARPQFEQALVLAEESGDRALEARIAANRIYVLWRSGDLPRMEASVAAEIARLDRTGLVEAAGGQLLVARAVALHGMGRWSELGVHLEEALSSRGRLGAQVELMLRLVAVELSADLGHLAHAQAAFEELVGHPAIDDPEVRYDATGVRLQIATLAGDVPPAARQELAARAISLAEATTDTLAAARLRVGVMRLMAQTAGMHGGPLDLGGLPLTSTAPTDSDAPAEVMALRAEEAAWLTGQGWPEAINAWDGMLMPYRRAWTEVWGARAAAREGDTGAALGLLESAERTAQDLSAAPLAAAAQRLARQLGRRASRKQGRLTSRERDVLAEAARGSTNREIARALGMSERTVAVHLSRVFAKLGAGTRGEAVHMGRHLGEIGPPS